MLVHCKGVRSNVIFDDIGVQSLLFFFHEYGRRVGMVPRSSLKEGKYSQMVEKRTKTTQQQTKQNQPQPTGRDSTTK